MKKIKLTQGQFTLVDDEDYGYLMQWKWHLVNDKYNCYAVTNIKINNKYTTIKMHRLIMRTLDNMQVDHIDHNGLNNQKSNLRNCTKAQNQMNRRSCKNKQIKYLGVYKIDNKYRARIRVNNRNISLGCFDNIISAAKRYDDAAILKPILYHFTDYMAHDDRPDHGMGILKGYRDMKDEEKSKIFYLSGRLRRTYKKARNRVLTN